MNALRRARRVRRASRQYARPRDADTKGWMIDYTSRSSARSSRGSTSCRASCDSIARTTRTTRRCGASRRSTSAPHLDGERDDNDAITKQLTAQLDYTRPFGTRTKLETGYKGTRAGSTGTSSSRRTHWARAMGAERSEQRVSSSTRPCRRRTACSARASASSTCRAVCAPSTRSALSLSPRRRRAIPYNYTSLFPSGVASVQVERRDPDQGELLAPHSPPGHTGAQSVPVVLRRAERVHRQPEAES